MIESQLQEQSEATEITVSDDDAGALRTLEHEIECPRCHADMSLGSEFDNLCYFCEECDFCLFTL